LQVLSGSPLVPPPVVFHSWGDYKIEFAGIHPKFQYYIGGSELAEIEVKFYKRFRTDWFHLGSAGWQGLWHRARITEGERAFIASADGSRWIEIKDDYSLTDYSDVPRSANNLIPKLESKSEIDDYFASIATSDEEILASGRFDHLSILAQKYGDSVLIAINDGAPGSWIHGWSFEDIATSCVEKPDLVEYFIYKDCERFLADVRAAKAAGAHAYIFSEGFLGSLDSISPAMHERLELDTKRWFYTEVRKIGLLPIGYFLGDVRPNMQFINSIDMAGLMIEESKKTFTLDPVEIRQALRQEVCLFGNVDSTLLLCGTPCEIKAEVERQLRAAKYGPFVLANGSPLIIGTPQHNLDAYMRAAGR
ncbi:MAG: uroporphyrinogen decarboxylase family protein, partial [Armatimonadota bacterium]|nr:uroporphyrinogen decarboxylase family protein [Armatimonadota bacterium]